MKILLAIAMFFSCFAYAGNVIITQYTVTNATSTAYLQATAATPITVTQMYVCDTSGQLVKVAAGASGSEVDLFSAPVSGCALFPVNPYLVAGSRISLKSTGLSLVSGGASTGYNSISLLP